MFQTEKRWNKKQFIVHVCNCFAALEDTVEEVNNAGRRKQQIREAEMEGCRTHLH